MSPTNARTALLVLSVLLAVLEFADGFRLAEPWAPWIFALLLLGGAYWLSRSPGIAPAILLGALHLVELLMLVFVFRTSDEAPPSWLFAVFVVVSTGGVVAAAVLAMTGRRTPLAS